MWGGMTRWSLPVVAARGECGDVPYALGRTEMFSCDIGTPFRGVAWEGPCERAGHFYTGFRSCEWLYPKCGGA